MLSSSVLETIVDYLPHLSEAQQEAVLHVVKAFASTCADSAIHVDDDYARTIERRFQELESGVEPGIPWEEVKRKGRTLLAKR